MNKMIWLLISVFVVVLSGCGKPNPTPEAVADVKNQVSQTNDTSLPSDNSVNASTENKHIAASDTTNPEKTSCLNVDKPFCKVFESEGECDPKLNEYHYKAGDQLYWINRTQYDTVDCYYTEEEFNKDHNPSDCSEIQDDGKGCIIDDSPGCNLMLSGDDCTVSPTRSSCDERLLELNKNIGDTLPGIWIEKDNTIHCFYTKKERDQFLKHNKMKCTSSYMYMDHICMVKLKRVYSASGSEGIPCIDGRCPWERDDYPYYQGSGIPRYTSEAKDNKGRCICLPTIVIGD